MTLRIYEQTSPGVYSDFSIDGDFSNPLTTTHDGKTGSTLEMKLYVGRASGSTSSYERIQVKPVSLTSDNDIDPTGPSQTGWGVKVMADPGHTPTETEWSEVDYGAAVDIADISDNSKLPFWYRIESPAGIRAGNKKNIALVVMFTEVP